MKTAFDRLKDIFWPKKEYRVITMLFFILVAIFLILTANVSELRSNVASLQRLLPNPENLATSPIAMEMLKEKQGQTPRQETPSPKSVPSQSQEPEAKPNAVPQNIVVPAEPSTAPVAATRSDMLIIPKLGVTAPIVTAQTTDSGKLKSLLDSGALIYPGSADFGGAGQTVILGHSAPPNWPQIKHDTIFSRIVELSPGDKIIAVYNDKTYNYSVLEQRIIEKSSDVPNMANGGNTLFLVTCWPPGRDLKRIIVQAKLDSVE